MGFVRDDDDIASLGEGLVGRVLLGSELMDRREDDSAAGTVQEFPEMLPALSLNGHLSQRLMTPLKLPEELVIQIIPVRQHDEGRILHRRMTGHPTGIKEHREALAASLRVPDDTGTAITQRPLLHRSGPVGSLIILGSSLFGHATRTDRLLDGHIHGVELVIACDDLVDCPVIRILLVGHEMLQQSEEASWVKDPTDQHLQLQGILGSIPVPLDRPPHLEPLVIRRQRSHPRLQTIGDHEDLVVAHQ